MKPLLSLHRVGLLAPLLFVNFGSCLHAQTEYSVTDIGTLGGTEGLGYAVNARGQVVGYAFLTGPDAASHAFRTASNRSINPATDDLGTLGGTESAAYSVDIWGHAVGAASVPGDTNEHAFRTAPNSPIDPATDDLGTLGGTESTAFGINLWGQVVGFASYVNDTVVGPVHAFRTAPNRSINPATDDLGTLGGTQSAAYGINDWGQVVGAADISGDIIRHAFRTAPNRSINPATDDLGTLGGTQSEADGINDWGQVVGYASTSGDTTRHAFRTAPNRPINPAADDLGTLGGTSEALAINNRGEVVGYSFTDNDDTIEHAFLFRGGVMRDLNDLIPADSDWVLGEADGVNDAGQIVGIGTHGGQLRPFLLTPARK